MSCDHGHNVANLPQPVVHASPHRWRATERLVNAGEVLVHEVQCDCGGVVLDFLWERICQARKPAHPHPH